MQNFCALQIRSEIKGILQHIFKVSELRCNKRWIQNNGTLTFHWPLLFVLRELIRYKVITQLWHHHWKNSTMDSAYESLIAVWHTQSITNELNVKHHEWGQANCEIPEWGIGSVSQPIHNDFIMQCRRFWVAWLSKSNVNCESESQWNSVLIEKSWPIYVVICRKNLDAYQSYCLLSTLD